MSDNRDETSPSPLRGRLLRNPATLISLVVGILLLVTLATRLDIDWNALGSSIRDSNPLLLGLALIVYYANFPIRGLRWRALAENVHLAEKLPSRRAFGEAVFLGWFVNAVSWFRMGDPYRAYLVSRQGTLSYPATLGTLVAERILDLISFAVLLALVGTLIWTGEPNLTTTVLIAAIGLAALALLLLAGMAFLGPRWGYRLPGPLRGWYERFHAGTLDSLGQRLPLLATLSIVGWAAEAGRLYLVTLALGISVPLPAIAFVALAHNLITAIPLTPGGLGLAEAGMVGLLVLWLPVDAAVTITLLDRGISYVSVLVLGGLLFGWREGVKRGRF